MGMKHGDSFSAYNPVINFTFYIGAVVFGMFFIHPAFLLCSIVLSAAYYITVRGFKAWKLFAGMAPLFVIITAINPIFNTYGQHVLFTYFDRPYTMEAMFYGMAVAGMFITIMLWFASYNVVMTSDKFMYLFGKVAPSLTLVLTMVLRLIPTYRKRIIQIATARKSIGKGGTGESKRENLEDGMTIASTMTTWALEGGIITADSMRSRGYGAGKRTSFSIYRFEKRDALLMVLLILMALIVLLCGLAGGAETTYTPEIHFNGFDNPYLTIGLAAYMIFLATPTILNIVEDITWRILRSKI